MVSEESRIEKTDSNLNASGVGRLVGVDTVKNIYLFNGFFIFVFIISLI